MKLTTPKSKHTELAPKAVVTVHGNIVQPEYPEHIEEVSRKGWGATFWGIEDTTNWFHLPFCLASTLDAQKPLLTRVSLYFHNTSRSPITAVHLYDGARLLQSWNDLRLSGDHVRASDKTNTFVLTKPTEILFGLGLSVQVAFPPSTESKPPRWILFSTATAELRI